MVEEISKIAIPAAAGLLSGVIGSLIAPWVTWGIEKRRALLAARRDFLKECRDWVYQAPAREDFRVSPVYARLRHMLSAKTVEIIESDTIFIVRGGRNNGANNYGPLILDDIARIEREWGLI